MNKTGAISETHMSRFLSDLYKSHCRHTKIYRRQIKVRHTSHRNHHAPLKWVSQRSAVVSESSLGQDTQGAEHLVAAGTPPRGGCDGNCLHASVQSPRTGVKLLSLQ